MLSVSWVAKNYTVRVLYTVVKFGWLALLSIGAGYVYGFGTSESILMILPLQAVLIADFGLSVVASVERMRPSYLVVIVMCLIATCSTMLVYIDSIGTIFNFAEQMFLFFLIFLFSCSVVIVNCVDAIARSNGSTVPISIAMIVISGIVQILVSLLMYLDFKCFYYSIYIVFFAFALMHTKGFFFSGKFVITSRLYPKFLFFLNGVLLVYFGTRYDISRLSGEQLTLLDMSEKIYAVLIFPVNVLLNLLHSKGIDLRTKYFYMIIFIMSSGVIGLYFLGFHQVSIFFAIYFFKMFFSIYSYYGNYVDRTMLSSVVVSLIFLGICIVTKIFLVPVERYLEVTVIMIVGVFIILASFSRASIIYNKGS